MLRAIQLLFVLIGLNSFSQNSVKFKPGIEITQNEKISEYKQPTSILFIFEGHTHMIHNYLDLKDHIQKGFKKKLKKDFRDFKLDFNYKLNAEKPTESDLNNIPTKKHNEKEYETICYISITDFKSWDNHLIDKRKQSYYLNIELKDKELNELVTSKLQVNSYYAISTENKNSSKLIYKIIMGNP